jgi:hypothetical protein
MMSALDTGAELGIIQRFHSLIAVKLWGDDAAATIGTLIGSQCADRAGPILSPVNHDLAIKQAAGLGLGLAE